MMEPLNFETPLALLLFVRPDFTPDKWQIEELERIGGRRNPSDTELRPWKIGDPLIANYCTFNGAGKDTVITAAAVNWVLTCHRNGLAVVTTASWDQMNSQTGPAIKKFATELNNKLGMPLIEMIDKEVRCKALESECYLKVTNEPGRMEGNHNRGGPFMVVINETKSIANVIIAAMGRYSKVTHRLNISTPGKATGYFYDQCTNADIVYPNHISVSHQRFFRRVSALQVSYADPAFIINIVRDYGEDSDMYRSAVLALFTDVDNDGVFHVFNNVNEGLFRFGPKLPKRAGIDLAFGGSDRCQICVMEGNRIKTFYSLHERSIHKQAFWIKQVLASENIQPHNARLDCGGPVDATNQELIKSHNLRLIPYYGNAAARNSMRYKHRNAEDWFFAAELNRHKLFSGLGEHQELNEQLLRRRFEYADDAGSKIKLEAKKTAAIRGEKSPDLADAFIMCVSGDSYNDYIETPIYGQGPAPQVNILTTDIIERLEEQLRERMHYGGKPDGTIRSLVQHKGRL